MDVFPGLMGIFEKRRFRNFLVACNKEEDLVKACGADWKRKTMKEVYDKFGLDENTQDFVGHAIALYHNDE